MLSSVSVQEQKQMLGERLFPLIQAMHRDLAGKITGMLLEIDNSELIHMLESGESLRAKVAAFSVCCSFDARSYRHIFQHQPKRLAGNNVSEMTYFVSSGT